MKRKKQANLDNQNQDMSPIKKAKIVHDFKVKEIEIINNFLESLVLSEEYKQEIISLIFSKTNINDISLTIDIAQDIQFTLPLLHHAVEEKNAKMIKLLLKHGADIDSKDTEGETPLHLAIANGYFDIVKFLLKHKANINVENNYEETPLHYAVEFEDPELVELLLENGANKEARDYIGETPLYLAAKYGLTCIIKMLVKYGSDINAKDYNDEAPLDWVVGKEYINIVKLLLMLGANPEVKLHHIENLEINNMITIAKAIKILSIDASDGRALDIIRDVTPPSKELIENIINNKIHKVDNRTSKIESEQSLYELLNLHRALSEYNKNQKLEENKYNTSLLEEKFETWHAEESEFLRAQLTFNLHLHTPSIYYNESFIKALEDINLVGNFSEQLQQQNDANVNNNSI